MDDRKTVLYLRESVNDELGIARHRKDCQRMCTSKGWRIEAEYVDNDESASPERRNGKPRPAYTQMLDDVRAGRIGRVVAWHADRLYRHPRELEDIIDLCQAHGVGLATVGGDLDLSSDMGRQVARILGAVARGEVERKSARQKLGAKQRAENGALWWPSRPFGYRTVGPDTDTWSPTGKDIELHPSEAPLVADAYSRVLAGDSLNAIATDWNMAGVTTPKGCVWRGAQVRQLLINSRNAALRTYSGDKSLPRAERVGMVAASWPAIVDRDVWEGVCAVLADPARRNGADRGRKYLLSGLASCGLCGSLMGSGATSAGPVYRCKSCHRVSRSVAKVDAYVCDWVTGRLAMPDAAELLVSEKRDDIVQLRERAAALRKRLNQLATDFADGDLTPAQLKTATVRIKEQLAQLDTSMQDRNRARVFEGVIGVDDVAAAFVALTLDRQRAVVAAMVTVTIEASGRGKRFDPALVVIDWK